MGKKSSQKIGLPPGTLVHVGEQKVDTVRITLMKYDQNDLEEKELSSIEECASYLGKPGVMWVNIEGIHDEKIIEQIGKFFEISSLTLEDVMNTTQRAKIENFENYLYFVMQAVFQEENKPYYENLSIILGKNFVLSFEEKQTVIFEKIKQRIRTSAGRIRKSGHDYLVYALIDSITDNSFPAIEAIGEKLETLEGVIIKNPEKQTMNKIHTLKRDIIFFLRMTKPLREMLSQLERDRPEIISDETFTYFHDVYDHVTHQVETLGTYSEIDTGLYQMYLSGVNNKTNEVMKMLTLIASIFIPLTFITGIYGMNFAYMPEIAFGPSYFIVLVIMAAIAAAMVGFFKKKHWI